MNFLLFPSIGALALLDGLGDLFFEACLFIASKVSVEMIIQLTALCLVHLLTGG